jgi:3-keto-5-aminohexanoate cleavage enzyme
MATHATWLEVSLNGPWSRERQPLIPITVAQIVEDGIACARAGAAIIHVHAYDEQSGRQKDDADIYAAIIEGIRAKEDVIVYPTLPFAGHVHASDALTATQRFAHVEVLARRGLLEWSVVDPGSTHITALNDIASGKQGFLYANPEAHIRRGLEFAQEYRYHPGYAIYEPAFLRLGAALARTFAGMPQPVYRFMFSDGFSFGFPPEEYALAAYLQLLERVAPGAPWMVGGLDVDVTPLIEFAVTRGGHVRVGLEDAPLGTNRPNVQWVHDAARRIEAAGGHLASAQMIRRAMTTAEKSAAPLACASRAPGKSLRHSAAADAAYPTK